MWTVFRRHDNRLTCDELYRLRVYFEKMDQAQGNLRVLTMKQREDLGRLIRKQNKEMERSEATQS